MDFPLTFAAQNTLCLTLTIATNDAKSYKATCGTEKWYLAAIGEIVVVISLQLLFND